MHLRSSVPFLAAFLILGSGCGRSMRTDGTPLYMGRSMEHLADSAGVLSAAEVAASDNFRACDRDVPNMGVSGITHWFRFSVTNRSDEPEMAVAITHTEIDRLALYTLEAGRPILLGKDGQEQPQAFSLAQEDGYAFHVPVQPGATVPLLLQVSGHKQIHVPVIVDSPLAMATRHLDRSLYIGVFAGIMLVLTLYNLFVYLSIRDGAYLIYAAYIVVNGLGQLTLLGTTRSWLWPDSPWLATNASVLLVLLSIAAGILFTRRFIGTAIHVPAIDRFLPLFYVAIGLNLVLYLQVDRLAGFKMAQGISGCASFVLLWTAIKATRNGSRQGTFFLLAWSTFLVGVVLFVLKDGGVLPYTEFTANAMPVGSALEGILLSFGLADRINILRREKERSQAQALAAAEENARITRDQNTILEQKVVERTQQLQESLNRLKEAQSQLVEAEKMSSLGQLTAGIAHEINNPINYIRSNIKPLRRDLEDVLELLAAYRRGSSREDMERMEQDLGIDETVREVGAILSCMEEGADRTADIVRGLRTFSRVDEDDLKLVDVNEGLQSTINLLRPQLKDRIVVQLDLRAERQLECLPGRLNQVFMNILTNAVQAIVARHGEEGGHLLVRSEDDHERLMVTIVDNGHGMSAATRARVFEPFFTTKNVGEGTGLGLSIVHSIVEKHQGRIDLESIEGEGTMFRIVLPLRQPLPIAKRA
jgi:signal transduction histidine kinase